MTTLPVADARANFSKIVDTASTTHERFEITRNGTRAAVLLGADDYDSLMETLEILNDPELVAGIREGQRDIDEGRVFTSQQMREAMRAAGRGE
ncbi:MAG: type II toxin-antitoxin system Phd/YefM family antitoxin [Pseudolysinimonas sp.]